MFDIYAFSYCPINSNLKFSIYFGNKVANCFFNDSKNLFSINYNKLTNKKIASCHMEIIKQNLNDYYFPKALSKDNLFLKIYNYREYLTSIFMDFSCSETNNCILKVLLYEKMQTDKFKIRINQKPYYCFLDDSYIFQKIIFPTIKVFNCTYFEQIFNEKRIVISGLPDNIYFMNKTRKNDVIPKKFIIQRITADNDGKSKKIIIIGKLVDNLKNSLYIFSIHFLFPNVTLQCNLIEI